MVVVFDFDEVVVNTFSAIIGYMRTASDNVQQLSDRIRSVFPTLRQESSEKLDLMDSEVTGAQTKLNEMKTQTESEVHSFFPEG